MEYFYKKNHFHLLKNYILKDPLSDWFNIQEYLKNEEYKKDESSHYKDYIIKESNRYKIDLLQFDDFLSNYDQSLTFIKIDKTAIQFFIQKCARGFVRTPA